MWKFLQKIWPPVMIAVGLSLTAVWIGLFGYGLAYAIAASIFS